MNQWFTKRLLKWHQENPIEMPWKNTTDPYAIWLSEVILQQTRVAQGLPYYVKILAAYPTVQHMANAPIDALLKLWQGLGYYSRARNLHETAKHVSKVLNGKFPNSYTTLLNLTGVGPYTAAAIASFCYNEKVAVVDGNVYRVLARIFGITTPIDSSIGKTEFQFLANQLISSQFPAAFNQAIMNYGSSVCMPLKPLCNSCVFNNKCVAFYNQNISLYPQKSKKLNIKKREFQFILIIDIHNNVIIEKRLANDIWKGLFQFPVFEGDTATNQLSLNDWLTTVCKDWSLLHQSEELHQTLTHQKLTCKFYIYKCSKIHEGSIAGNQHLVTTNKLKEYAWPKVIATYLENHFITN
jgi:A/G-specific adenine glycosylase